MNKQEEYLMIDKTIKYDLILKKYGVSVDPFYSESNIRYLENIVHDIDKGKAHFAEHDLIDVD